MKNFVFYNPTKVLFGKGMTQLLIEEISKLGIKKILIHYGKESIKKNGLYDEVINLLNNFKIKFIEVSGVKPNPTLDLVREAVNIAKKEKIDAILAIGGGSVIDSAKAIGRGYYYNGDIWDLFERKAESTKSLPVFTILTLSATGSEMNSNSVVSNDEELKKWPMSFSPESFPVISVIDPDLQKTLPENQTVNGAVDTLSHVFEFYFDGTSGNDLNDEFAEAIIRTTITHTRILLKDKNNYHSRSQLAWCATNALNNILSCGRNGGDWATHGIEHSVSAFYDIAHGAGLAVIFPAWMKYVYKNDIPRFARFAEKVFGIVDGKDEEKALKGIESLIEFYKEINAPLSLRTFGVKEDDLMKMAENATMKGSLGKFKKLEKNDVYQIYRLAY